ncbi:hypothetical protein ACFXPW_08280 [Streptomyces goshikiensis]
MTGTPLATKLFTAARRRHCGFTRQSDVITGSIQCLDGLPNPG